MSKYYFAPALNYSSGFLNQILFEINSSVNFYTEMFPASGIGYNNTLYKRLKLYNAHKIPTTIQLYGNDPKPYIKNFKIIKDLGFKELNINMGCPSKSVLSSKHGAYFLKDKKLAYNLISKIIDKIDMKISIKTRLGWYNKNEIFEFIENLYKLGITKFIIHARIVQQNSDIIRYDKLDKYKADWNNIYKLKKIFNDKITIIGNGDICSLDDANKKIKNLDGVMTCRATFNCLDFYNDNKLDNKQLNYYLKKLVISIYENFNENGANGRIKSYLIGYLKNYEFKKDYFNKLKLSKTEKEFFELIDIYSENYYNI